VVARRMDRGPILIGLALSSPLSSLAPAPDRRTRGRWRFVGPRSRDRGELARGSRASSRAPRGGALCKGCKARPLVSRRYPETARKSANRSMFPL
jgi:hypothetical protein